MSNNLPVLNDKPSFLLAARRRQDFFAAEIKFQRREINYLKVRNYV